MKRIIFLYTALLFGALGTGDIAAQEALQKAIISTSSPGIYSLDLEIARVRGFFREEGLEPQVVQMRASTAIAAGISGNVDALGSIGSAIRAIQRGAPLRVLAVTLRHPLFWLVARPEYRSIKELKGKTLGVVTFGGSQHTNIKRMLAAGGLDPEKDITTIQIGDEATQLQALVTGALQVAGLSPPFNIIGRDKYGMNLLENSMKFSSIQNGIAVQVSALKEKRDLLKRLLRARAKGNRFFFENEREAAEILARSAKTDLKTALETIRLSKPAFTRDGIPSEQEIAEYLAADAEILKLTEPFSPSRVFDFTLLKEVNGELGIR